MTETAIGPRNEGGSTPAESKDLWKNLRSGQFHLNRAYAYSPSILASNGSNAVLGSGSFAVSDGATWITQRCWESKGIMVEQMKLYLGHTSVEGPPKYIRYGWEALEYKGERPRIHRLGSDRREFLSFQLGSERFVVAAGAAQVTKRRWEHEEIQAEE
ncbi:hypothetical protein DUI87_24341 [Hirundo rustica rustica]|uniref:MHC class I-like antigen recognition-like domain-containing protein n=1 Tax=Hirundo rustica rustica TaxID=333673 RepID=A0A3M0JDW4_HIRRU|nr:hypothetical protein DUI87_24341 [Hirundo rustica rustica]